MFHLAFFIAIFFVNEAEEVLSCNVATSDMVDVDGPEEPELVLVSYDMHFLNHQIYFLKVCHFISFIFLLISNQMSHSRLDNHSTQILNLISGVLITGVFLSNV